MNPALNSLDCAEQSDEHVAHFTGGKMECPTFSEQQAIQFVHDIYGFSPKESITIRSLPSYDDQNFRVKFEGEEYVFKISNLTESEGNLAYQQSVMKHLQSCGYRCTTPIQTVDGLEITSVPSKSGTSRHLVRMLRFVPGTLLSQVQHSNQLLENIGAFMAGVDLSLQNFEHKGMHRQMAWDLTNFLGIEQYIQYLATEDRKVFVSSFVDRFKRDALPKLPSLRKQIIHGDANDYNIIVDEEGRDVTGVIDFGDSLYTCAVFDLAINSAYTILDKADPIDSLAHIVAGFHKKFPLTKDEISLLYLLACSRLCFSVTMSAYGQSLEPDNEYLKTTEMPGWRTLEKLAAANEQDVIQKLLAVCNVAC